MQMNKLQSETLFVSGTGAAYPVKPIPNANTTGGLLDMPFAQPQAVRHDFFVSVNRLDPNIASSVLS